MSPSAGRIPLLRPLHRALRLRPDVLGGGRPHGGEASADLQDQRPPVLVHHRLPGAGRRAGRALLRHQQHLHSHTHHDHR